MDIIMINCKMNDITYKFLNMGSGIIYLSNIIKTKPYRQKNKALKDIHKGETCYIIGNGPSLKKTDLSVLSDKIVFTVNKMINVPEFDILKPRYHCMCDRLVIEDVFDKLEDKIARNDYGTKFLLHCSVYERLKKYDNAYFIYGKKICTEKNVVIDITKNCNGFINVVPFAIRNAIYMGFKRIILLGCDFSFFASRRNMHFYEENEMRQDSLYEDLSGSAIALLEYKRLYEYCAGHDIELVNCTPETFLDVILQGKLADYLD